MKLQKTSDRESDISSSIGKIFSYLICELNIYLDQTRGDCGEINQHCSGESDFVYVEFE